MTPHDWDVLVIGRSYAGLSAALTLGRARRSVLVVGTGGPRNEAVAHTHGLLTHDGAAPAAVIANAEAELRTYPTVELVTDRVTGLAAVDGGFRASIGPRTSSASALILATGVNDNPPPIAGLAEHWGRGVFTCPYCDGFEHQDTHLAVVGSPLFIPHMARLLTGWSGQVTVFNDGLDGATRADLVAHGVGVETVPVVGVNGDGDRAVSLTLSDGSIVPIGALFVAELPTPNNRLAVELGCAIDEHGFVVVDAFRRTTVPGAWAIGDVHSRQAAMSVAIADGTIAAAQCNAVLVERQWALTPSR